MPTEVILPKVDMDMATGIVSKWHVADGDQVKKGQPIFDIETDKSAMEIEAPATGTIRLREPATGMALDIGSVLALIFGEGENQDLTARPLPMSKPDQAVPNPAAVLAAANPVEHAVDLDLRATPLARRMAREMGRSLSQIIGSGPNGRIVAADVSSAAAIDSKPPMASEQTPNHSFVAFDAMRRTIAQRLTQSKQTVPHFYLQATCTIDQLLQLRERLKNGLAKTAGGKLSLNDFIIKALAHALQRVPQANVSFVEGGFLQHKASDIGVAVAVEGGLFTPVLRAVETKSLSQISAEMKDLASRARNKKLQPSEYQGGAAAISNLGMFGVENFAAIINPPQASILAVGAAVERFIPINRLPVLATQILMTLACDHRLIDGALGAKLLQTLKALVEDPALMLL